MICGMLKKEVARLDSALDAEIDLRQWATCSNKKAIASWGERVVSLSKMLDDFKARGVIHLSEVPAPDDDSGSKGGVSAATSPKGDKTKSRWADDEEPFEAFLEDALNRLQSLENAEVKAASETASSPASSSSSTVSIE